MHVIRRHLWIRGRVQGVFFRQSTWQRARAIGQLSGWVRNLSDGRVEVLVEGPDEQVEQLVAFCQHGPSGAHVDELQQQEESPQGDLGDFEIRH